MQPPPGQVPLGWPQPDLQSFLNNFSWKEVPVVVIGHLEVVLLPLLWGMRGPRQVALAEKIV